MASPLSRECWDCEILDFLVIWAVLELLSGFLEVYHGEVGRDAGYLYSYEYLSASSGGKGLACPGVSSHHSCSSNGSQWLGFLLCPDAVKVLWGLVNRQWEFPVSQNMLITSFLPGMLQVFELWYQGVSCRCAVLEPCHDLGGWQPHVWDFVVLFDARGYVDDPGFLSCRAHRKG